MAAQEQGLVVVSTARADGTPQASVVNAGVLEHPGDGSAVIGLVARGDALKPRLLRRRATVCSRSPAATGEASG
jgi:hypothetical protein